MDSSFIPASVQNIWNEWNIRGFMILSLCMQLILALTTPFRKKTCNGFFVLVVWSTYLLVDWTALFAYGMISNAGCRSSEKQAHVPKDVMTFWAAFLLVHLGGPDSITAFSLEDNALWLRHVLGLISKLVTFLYLFTTTLPSNKLLATTILIFVSGMIKYGERTRALYLASLENLKKSVKKTPHLDTQTFPSDKFNFSTLFKGFMVDVIPDQRERNECKIFILSNDARQVFRWISMDLNLVYEFFYTKIEAANSIWGIIVRNIACYSTLVAFILFCRASKDEFRAVDVVITYALLAGVFALDIISAVMVVMSDWKNTNDPKYLCLQVFGQGFFPYLVGLAIYHATKCFLENSSSQFYFDRLWSEKMNSFNLLSHCFDEFAPRKFPMPGFMWEKLAEMRSTSEVVLDPKLWELVYEEVKRKAMISWEQGMKRVHEARGDWVIEESRCPELMHYISDFEYDNTLLMWHIATEICYSLEGDVVYADPTKIYSKILSDYMMYLLVKQPKLMSPVAGIGRIRYEDTCLDAKILRRKSLARTKRDLCILILGGNTRENSHEVKHSVLMDSCMLFDSLQRYGNRWTIIFKVWVELLWYAAGHCKADSHARLLSEGGELITFVWILIVTTSQSQY